MSPIAPHEQPQAVEALGPRGPEALRRPVLWRRPGVIVFVYAFRLLSALVIAGPVALAVGRFVAGYPRGDAVLFDPGALVLLDTLRLARGALASAAMQGVVTTLFVAFAGLLPLAALIAALGRSGPVTVGWLAERATRHLGTFSLLFGLAIVAQVVVTAILYAFGAVLAAKLPLTDPGATAVRLSAAGVCIVAVVGIGILHDLARVAAVDADLRLYSACTRAWQALRNAKAHTVLAYAGRAAAMVLVVWAALRLGRWIGLERGWQIALAWLVHQLAIFAAVVLRASWLAAAVGIVRRVAPAGEVEPVQEEPVVDRSRAIADEAGGGDVQIVPEHGPTEPIAPVALDAEPPAGNVAPPGTS